MEWEYKVVFDTREPDELNAMGSQGWELVAFLNRATFFKRPVIAPIVVPDNLEAEDR